MAEYVAVRSNWTSLHCIPLDRVCEICIEEKDPTARMEKSEENTDEDHRTSSSDETVPSVTLRSNETEQREDPVIILNILRSEKYYVTSIQLLSSAKHIELYHQEYLGTCQGSRVTELDSESIYESNFEFSQTYEQITMKCLKLADVSELVIYCLQINLSELNTDVKSPSMPAMHLPFDMTRVRSMVDEKNLSSNARQFMNDLAHVQERRRPTDATSQPSNLSQLMLMMKGMNATDTSQLSALSLTPLLSQLKSVSSEEAKSTGLGEELVKLEQRLERRMDTCFAQLQQHIDDRFDLLEEKLGRLHDRLEKSCTSP